ncbi:MAG: putative transport protein [Thermodesulfobacteriota bacterium]|nr:putative transport protein [Thermodesulfobacteriota bacterium]
MQTLIHDVFQLCRENPSMLLFASLAAGYALGKVKFGTFSLGSTTSVLIVAIVLGAMILGNTHFDLGLIKTISFGLFIFAIGYKVGPDFVGGLKRGGVKYVTVSIFFCVVALVAAVVLAKLFSLNSGYSGGLLAGALTQSSAIGTASGAIQKLTAGRVTEALDLRSDIAVAYAVTYVFGTAGVIILLKILPGLWRINLPEAAKGAEAQLGSMDQTESVEAFHWSNLVVPRAYRVDKKDAIGKTVQEVEALFPERVAIDRIKKGDQVIDHFNGDVRIDKGNIVVLTGFRSRVFNACEIIGPEVDDKVVQEMVGEILGICVTNKAVDGKPINEIFMGQGHGCFISNITRQGHELPLAPKLRVHRGDIISVIGAKKDVDALVSAIGHPERRTQITDLVTVGIGIIVGTLIGLLSINVGGVPITLGVGGGVLVSGIFFGWLRSVRPTWGQIPTPAQWIFTDLGLNLFIACVGISAGPEALAALKQAGVNIFLAGVCLTCIPHIATWLFGLYLIKLNPVLLLGAMTGAGTITAALNSVKDDSKSAVAVIGYTVPYAIGNVLLTVWGALVVNMV